MGFRLQQKSMTLNDLERGRTGRLLSVALTSCIICVELETGVSTLHFTLTTGNTCRQPAYQR